MIPTWVTDPDSEPAPNRVYNIVRWRALLRLRDRHEAEYEKLLAKEFKRAGLPPKRQPRVLTADEELRQMYGV